MGYYCNKNRATVAEPSAVTLAKSPNFVVFAGKNNAANLQPMSATIKVLDTYILPANELQVRSYYTFKLIEKQTNTYYSYSGTWDKNKVSDTVFFVPTPSSLEGGRLLSKYEADKLVAQNIKDCLLRNPFLRNNFQITIGTTLDADENIAQDTTVHIVAKQSGSQYGFRLIENGLNIAVSYPSDTPYYQYALDFGSIDSTDDLVQQNGWLNIKVSNGTRTIFERKWNGTLTPENTNDSTYLLVPIKSTDQYKASYRTSMTNIATLLQKDTTLLTYLDVVQDDTSLFVKALNRNYTVDISAPFLVIKKEDISGVIDSDSIDYGTGAYQIELEVYTDHGVFLGEKETLPRMGNYLTTLTKSYFGQPLWFDLSTLLSKKVTYSPAFLSGQWVDAQTMTDYRFIAKCSDGVIHEPFYYSSPLYVLNGYNYALDPILLNKDAYGYSYLLDFSQSFHTQPFTMVKPLTTNFVRTHIKGQKQYFGFVHQSPRTTAVTAQIGLLYRVYTQSGVLVEEQTLQGQSESNFNKVNTVQLQLDQFLPIYNNKTVGRIDVYLCTWKKGAYPSANDRAVIISTPLSFRILPEILNEVNDFAFLNQLGGWDTMNLGGSRSSEFKAQPSTIYKTLQPDFDIHTEIESVALKTVQEQKTAETSPIDKQTLNWLQQMSASPAVYELSTQRYIIVDEMVLKNNSADELYQVEMKYHYCDLN